MFILWLALRLTRFQRKYLEGINTCPHDPAECQCAAPAGTQPPPPHLLLSHTSPPIKDTRHVPAPRRV